MLSKGKRRLSIAASAIGLAFAAIGVAHAPFARSLLMRVGGCPMAGARMTPVEAESARHMAVAVDRGSASAPARPALGFDLDSTTLAGARAWAVREHVACDDARVGLLKCSAVRPSALGLPDVDGTIDELALEFNAQERLVNITTFRAHLNPESAASMAHAAVSSLEQKLGPPQRRAGQFDAEHLSAQGVHGIATVMYRYADYVAEVTAMNTASGGPSIREHYMSARD
jgi:hypothetical protein